MGAAFCCGPPWQQPGPSVEPADLIDLVKLSLLHRGSVRQVNLHEAKTHLSRLVAEAVAGEGFVICKAGKPLVRVTRLEGDGDPAPQPLVSCSG